MNNIDIKIVSFVGFLVALTMHEAAHAFMAEFLGDNSPATKAKATINPIPHIDLFGTILLPFFMILTPSALPIVFGWAKPTIFNPPNSKKLRRDLNLFAVAGPGANFLIALICGIIAKLLGVGTIIDAAQHLSAAANPGTAILVQTSLACFVIGLLNFLPFPGSDGWKLIINNINYTLAQKLEKSSFIIGIVMIALLMIGGLNIIIIPCLWLFETILNVIT